MTTDGQVTPSAAGGAVQCSPRIAGSVARGVVEPTQARMAAALRVKECVAALAAGRMVVVIDDPDRENEGDLIVAAELITEAQMAFFVRHTTGIVCAPMSAKRADTLRLPLMVEHNTDGLGTAFTISVDGWDVGTGVSAADRTHTMQLLADPATRPEQLRRPGHVFPLRARAGGVLTRPGHTEAAVDLTTMAGLSGVGVIGEITAEDGTMRRGADLLDFAATHELPVLAISDLVCYRNATEDLVELVATSMMPTEFGDFRASAFRNRADGTEHLALVMGDIAAAGRDPNGALVRLHSECLTGDIIGSLRCDCGSQLEQSLKAVAAEGTGLVVYLRGHEGRGIGLAHKIHAYALQERGLDTVEANTAQGLPVDARNYIAGVQILDALGISRVRLITNNPDKSASLRRLGVQLVERVDLPVAVTAHNVRYLRTKRERMGHVLNVGGENESSVVAGGGAFR